MTQSIPGNLLYTNTHEWVRKEADGSLVVGVTDHAQKLMGDLVFIELPEEEAEYDVEAECCVLESVKAAADVYMPVAGTVVEVNRELITHPDLINQSPYEEGWIFKVEADSEDDLEELLSPKDYQELVASETH